MSNLAPDMEQQCDGMQSCSAIELLIQPRDKDLGDFSVRRRRLAVARRFLDLVPAWIARRHRRVRPLAADPGASLCAGTGRRTVDLVDLDLPGAVVRQIGVAALRVRPPITAVS